MPVYEIALTLSWFRISVTDSSTKQTLAPRISSTGLNHQSSASDLDSVEMAYDYATIGLHQGNMYTNNEYFMLVTLGYLAFKINQYRFFIRMVLIYQRITDPTILWIIVETVFSKGSVCWPPRDPVRELSTTTWSNSISSSLIRCWKRDFLV